MDEENICRNPPNYIMVKTDCLRLRVSQQQTKPVNNNTLFFGWVTGFPKFQSKPSGRFQAQFISLDWHGNRPFLVRASFWTHICIHLLGGYVPIAGYVSHHVNVWLAVAVAHLGFQWFPAAALSEVATTSDDYFNPDFDPYKGATCRGREGDKTESVTH